MPRPLVALPYRDLVQTWTNSDEPECSVLIPTYNHEEYIADAINGVLAQKTSFSFEVIVRDDASSDRTRHVVESFCVDYPGVVHLIASAQRTYPAKSPLRELQMRAKGGFVAICEGDDYWTDETKLERQVAALRRNPTMSCAFHQSVTLDARGPLPNLLGPEIDQGFLRDLNGDEIIRHPISFRSLVYRNVEQAILPERYDGSLWTEDTFLSVRLGLLGGATYVPGVSPSVYRLHETNLTTDIQQRPVHRVLRKIEAFMVVAEYLDEAGEREASGEYLHKALLQLVSLMDARSETNVAAMAQWAVSRLPRSHRLRLALSSIFGVNSFASESTGTLFTRTRLRRQR